MADFNFSSDEIEINKKVLTDSAIQRFVERETQGVITKIRADAARGKNAAGRKMKGYSDAYKKKRAKMGKTTDVVNLEWTGNMWQGFLMFVFRSGSTITAEGFFTDKANIAAFHDKDRGPITGINKKREQSITKKFNRLFTEKLKTLVHVKKGA